MIIIYYLAFIDLFYLLNFLSAILSIHYLNFNFFISFLLSLLSHSISISIAVVVILTDSQHPPPQIYQLSPGSIEKYRECHPDLVNLA